MNDTTPTVTEVRTALIREAADLITRRRAHHQAMRDIPAEMRENNPHFNALFDAYEGMALAGTRSQAIAAMLRAVAKRDQRAADDLASLIHDVMENGDDRLDGPNDDIWALIEREAEAAQGVADAEIAAADSELPTQVEIEAGR